MEEDGGETLLSSVKKVTKNLCCDVKVKLIKLEGGTAAPPPWQGKFACPDRRKRHPSP